MSEDGVLPFPVGTGPHTPLIPAVEALLFATGEPVRATAIAAALEQEDVHLVEAALSDLKARTDARGAGIELVQVAKGWQLRTRPAYARQVLALLGGKPTKLSRAALEVLAVVAYQQPATRMDVEQVRGVSSGSIMKTLIEKGLLRVSGRRSVPGKPLEYSTTPGVLELFGLVDLGSLPTLAERAALEEDRGP